MTLLHAKLHRRAFLRKVSTGIACSAMAHPLMTSVTLAGGRSENRLVVIILRGGMDGLDVVRPTGDANFQTLRGAFVDPQNQLDLDGFFHLHPSLEPIMPLWHQGELAFAHAVSTPYRNRRSHFDGQDILEAGTGLDVPQKEIRDGWLNRFLQVSPHIDSETAYAIGDGALKVAAGPAQIRRWSPSARLTIGDHQERLLEHIYHEDVLFRDTIHDAIELASIGKSETAENSSEIGALVRRNQGRGPHSVTAFAADRLTKDARIAAFSLSGWDTHANQARIMSRRLTHLAQTISILKQGLGGAWEQTTVLAMTEFGRTAWMNGSKGTDHGTGGVMIMAGGAIKGGKIYGKWPGLDEAELLARRDLMPTMDVRAYAAQALHASFGTSIDLLEKSVFPNLSMDATPEFMA